MSNKIEDNFNAGVVFGMSSEKELIKVNILIISSFIEPFNHLVCIDAVFLNEIDIWNYIEKKYYAMLQDLVNDIEKVKIDRCGVYVYLKTNNNKFDHIKYEICKRVVL